MEGLNYPEDAGNLTLKHKENRLLAKAFKEQDRTQKIRILKEIFLIRQYRRERIGKCMEYELFVETAEGMAEYAGTKALEMISPKKYAQRVEDYLDKLTACEPLLLDIRRISYYFGTMLALTAEKAGVGVGHRLEEEKRPLGGIIEQALEAVCVEVKPEEAPETIDADSVIKKMLEDSIIEKKQKVDSFFSSSRKEVSGDYSICGYDPMNMFLSGKFLYGKHFFMLKDRNSGEVITLNGESVLELVPNSVRQVCGYWK